MRDESDNERREEEVSGSVRRKKMKRVIFLKLGILVF
jgi:hypothetical protein